MYGHLGAFARQASPYDPLGRCFRRAACQNLARRLRSRSAVVRTASAKHSSASFDPETVLYSCRPIRPSSRMANPASRAMVKMSMSFLRHRARCVSITVSTRSHYPCLGRNTSIPTLPNETLMGKLAAARCPTAATRQRAGLIGLPTGSGLCRVAGRRPRCALPALLIEHIADHPISPIDELLPWNVAVPASAHVDPIRWQPSLAGVNINRDGTD